MDALSRVILTTRAKGWLPRNRGHKLRAGFLVKKFQRPYLERDQMLGAHHRQAIYHPAAGPQPTIIIVIE